MPGYSDYDRIESGLSDRQLIFDLDLRTSDHRSDNELDRAISDLVGKADAPNPPTSVDAAIAGALITDAREPVGISDVARSLGWTIDRLDSCLDDLAEYLNECGLALIHYSDDRVEVRAMSSHVRWAAQIRLSRLTAASSGISDRQAAVIRKLFDQDLVLADASKIVHETVKQLLHTGLAQETTKGVAISESVKLARWPYGSQSFYEDCSVK